MITSYKKALHFQKMSISGDGMSDTRVEPKWTPFFVYLLKKLRQMRIFLKSLGEVNKKQYLCNKLVKERIKYDK